jgi:hypothetical protein
VRLGRRLGERGAERRRRAGGDGRSERWLGWAQARGERKLSARAGAGTRG